MYSNMNKDSMLAECGQFVKWFSTAGEWRSFSIARCLKHTSHWTSVWPPYCPQLLCFDCIVSLCLLVCVCVCEIEELHFANDFISFPFILVIGVDLDRYWGVFCSVLSSLGSVKHALFVWVFYFKAWNRIYFKMKMWYGNWRWRIPQYFQITSLMEIEVISFFFCLSKQVG